MPLSITSRVENEIAILDLEGALTLGPTLRGLREVTLEVLNQRRPTGLIIQVAKVTTADSAGLGELTVAYTYTSKRGCRIALAGVNPNLRTMLEITRLDGLLPIAEDLNSAKNLVGKH
jgi:anti-anti-sigma factor